jgi:hypothetical protein
VVRVVSRGVERRGAPPEVAQRRGHAVGEVALSPGLGEGQGLRTRTLAQAVDDLLGAAPAQRQGAFGVTEPGQAVAREAAVELAREGVLAQVVAELAEVANKLVLESVAWPPTSIRGEPYRSTAAPNQ